MQVEHHHSAAVGVHPALLVQPGLFGQATNDITPLLGGTAESECLVLVGIGGAVFGVSASRAGEWVLDTACAVPLSGRFDLGFDGVKALRVTCINAAGHSREIHGDFTLKTLSPEIPTLETTTVDFARPVFAGRAEAGSELRIRVGGAIFLVLAGADGTWRVDTGNAAPAKGRMELGGDGRKTVGLFSYDAAGNTSEAEGSFKLESTVAGEPAPAFDKRLNPLGFELRPSVIGGTRNWWPFPGMKRARHRLDRASY